MNNPKDMLVSDPSALARELFPMQNRMPSWAVGRQRARQETAERTIEKLRPVYESELTKLRSERDELVEALRAVDGHLRDTFPPYAPGESPFDRVREVLAKHKPE